MTLAQLINGLHSADYGFDDLQQHIKSHYDYTPTAFSNGNVSNAAGQNEGSCRLFAFAQLAGLTKEDTLICFGQYYRDVQASPEGSDHANIRQFMRHGWSGICFSQPALIFRKQA